MTARSSLGPGASQTAANGNRKALVPSVPGRVLASPLPPLRLPSRVEKGKEGSLYRGLSVLSLFPHLLSTSELLEVSGDLKFK